MSASHNIYPCTVSAGDQRHEDIRKLVRSFFGGAWAEIPSEDVIITPIGGGITNLLFKAEGPQGETPVLVRLYGENTDILIDRDRDNHLFDELSRLGFAPPYHGRFSNGRLEGFMGAKALEPHHMSERAPVDFVSLIAAEMARMHLLPVTTAGTKGRAEIWNTLPTWLQLAQGLTFEDEAKAAAVNALDLEWMTQEVAWLEGQLGGSNGGKCGEMTSKTTRTAGDETSPNLSSDSDSNKPSPAALSTSKHCRNGSPNGYSAAGAASVSCAEGGSDEAVNGGTIQSNAAVCETVEDLAKRYLSDVVLSHNDLLSGNIMHAEGWDRVQVIDYEYSGYNPRGFDIANHFCEHAGFDSNFAKSYPSMETKTVYLAAYVRAIEESSEKQGGGESTPSPRADDPSFIAALATQVDRWTLPSHLFWAAWAVVQARYSPIDFDFVDYARLRLAGYRLHKEAFFGSGAS